MVVTRTKQDQPRPAVGPEEPVPGVDTEEAS